MTRAKPKYEPSPRIWNLFQVSTRLGWCEATFRQRRKELEGLEFPAHDAILGGWDSDAIEDWLDRRSGLGSGFQSVDDALMDALDDIEA